MILEGLSLANFRGFEQLDLSFDSRVTVIAGVNGVGKSGILFALTVLFSRSLPEFTAAQLKPIPFTDDDIYHGKRSLESSAIFTVANQRCHINVQRVREAATGDSGLLLLENVRTESVRTGNLDTAREVTQRALRVLKDQPAQPVVIFFSPRRQLPGKPKTLPKPTPFAPKEAYQRALDDQEVNLRQFMHWFRVQELSTHPQAPLVLARLREVMTTFLPEFINLRIESSPLRLLVDKAGIPLALNQLSDGERGMLAILFDITRRLAIANPDSDDPVAEGSAIVLIDEIELHLHPLWQRQVLKRFTETFARCQFVVTSHSPLVLGEVEGNAIRFLYRHEGKVASWTPDYALGLDTNRVLEDLMEVDSRDPATTAKLHEVAKTIDREQFDQARALIADLEAKIGNDADLVRSKALLSFLEGKE
jgi:predicted ATP-binding protein involved in virulence